MSRALLLAGALALGACSVETEGAACPGLGFDEVCPSGQRCGIDEKCSKNAVTKCPPVGAVVGVDPSKGGGTADIEATGFPDIALCRFATLAQAMSLAASKAPAAATVTVYADGTDPVSIDHTSTLVIPSNVTLSTELDPPDPARFILLKESGSTFVNVEGGAALRGFTVKMGANATGKAIEIVCGSPPAAQPALLESVVVDGGLKASAGVTVEGECALLATGLEVKRVAGQGLIVETGSLTVGATVNGASIHDNTGAGVRVTSGKLALRGSGALNRVADNEGGGVQLDGATVDAALEDLFVTGNGAVGLLVKTASGAAVRVNRTVFAKNGATIYGPGGATRDAGGVLLWAAPPTAFDFFGNTVCNNSGDQVAAYSSNAWSIAGGDTSCGNAQLVNRIDGVVTATSKLVYSTSGIVNARYIDWPRDPPEAAWFSAAGTVQPDPSCNLNLSLPAACQ